MKISKVTLINPPLLSQKGDVFSSGIPYFPIELAYLASSLKKNGFEAEVIDCFGEKPWQIWNYKKDFFVQGLKPEEAIERVAEDSSLVCFNALLVTAHPLNIMLIKKFRDRFPDKKAVVLENSQQVYGYSLRECYQDFLNAGADFVVFGEPEERVVKIARHLRDGTPIKINSFAHRKGSKTIVDKNFSFISDLDSLPYPAFEKFPLQNYWRLGYSHGPFSGKYLPMLTSRGCPYACRFCAVPAMNRRQWRARSPKNVVDEMQHWVETLGVTDFHWEDLNSNIEKKRMQEISKEIIARGLKVTWKLCSGSKDEAYDEETLKWMALGGCRYVSISPESGSPKVLKLMNKPFDHLHALQMVEKMNELGIRMQACFVLGYPGETEEDRQMTGDYLKKMVERGLDEVALFIMAPVPGSEQFKRKWGFEDYAQITFTPTFRKDFKILQKFRMQLYLKFFLWKLKNHTSKMLRNILNAFTHKAEIKYEMIPWHILYTCSKLGELFYLSKFF